MRGRVYLCSEKANNQELSSATNGQGVFVDTSPVALSQTTAYCCPGLSLTSSGAPSGLATPPLPLGTLRA